MSQSQKFNDILTVFCEKHGLGLIGREDNNVYEFYIDGMEIKCYRKGDNIVIHSSLGALPENLLIAESVLKNLLQLSLLNSETFGFVLSLDEQNGLQLSHRLILNNCLMTDLEESIEELLGHVEQYTQQLIAQDKSPDDMMFNMMSVV